MPDSIKGHIRAARSALVTARQMLNDEISSYPTPIAGCDVQFNDLLAERGKVRAALQALDQTIFVPTPRAPVASKGIESR
ncbi:hypothetical protein [Roseivivax sp. CAU 1753]